MPLDPIGGYTPLRLLVSVPLSPHAFCLSLVQFNLIQFNLIQFSLFQ